MKNSINNSVFVASNGKQFNLINANHAILEKSKYPHVVLSDGQTIVFLTYEYFIDNFKPID